MREQSPNSARYIRTEDEVTSLDESEVFASDPGEGVDN